MGTVTEEDRRSGRRKISDGMRVLVRLRRLNLTPDEISAAAGISVPEILSVTVGSLHDVDVKTAVAGLLGKSWQDLWPNTATLPSDPTIGPKLKLSPAQWRQFLHLEPVTDFDGIAASLDQFHAETDAFRATAGGEESLSPAVEVLTVTEPPSEFFLALTVSGDELGIVRTGLGFVLEDGSVVKRRSEALRWFRDRGAIIVQLPAHRVEEMRLKAENVYRYFEAQKRYQAALKKYRQLEAAFLSREEMAKVRVRKSDRIRADAIQAYAQAFANLEELVDFSEDGQRLAALWRNKLLSNPESLVIQPSNLDRMLRRSAAWGIVSWHGAKPHLLVPIKDDLGVITRDGRLLETMGAAIRCLVAEGAEVWRINRKAISPEMIEEMKAEAGAAVTAWWEASVAQIRKNVDTAVPPSMPLWEEFEADAGPWRPKGGQAAVARRSRRPRYRSPRG